MPYRLSATLKAHSDDVRAVTSPNNDLIISASRDASAIAWIRSSQNSFEPAITFRASDRFVNSVAYLPPSPDAPKGSAVTGGQDAIINVWAIDPSRSEPTHTLLGHTDNVCALHVGEDQSIISGSWDRTAKVWKDYQLKYDLKGHSQSVWAVLVVGNDQYLTGSADKSIKLWKQHKCFRSYQGHKDAVRALTLLTDIGFASASNDSDILLWTFEGDIIHTLSGHTSFVYSLSTLPLGDSVSAGEDRSVRIWRDGECAQTLMHPAISVWSVSVMPNGDIVTGASDGVVRVFTESDARLASAEELKTFDEQVAGKAIPSQMVGDVPKSDLPGPEVLSEPGSKPGQVKMVKNGAIVEAHQWDAMSSTWQKIGEVVDAVGSNRKQLYQGKEYDYVFDVDIQDGVPPLKLPYNANENPFNAAQRFLEQNDISMNYLDQVVQFIEKNTAGVTVGSGGGEEYQDPFTGASRYRASSDAPASASTYSDPFTGGSRYTPSAPTTPGPSLYNDSFTGPGRYVPPATAPEPAARSQFPLTDKVASRGTSNLNGMHERVLAQNEALSNENSTLPLAMYPEEAVAIEEIFSNLSFLLAGNTPSNPLTPPHFEVVAQLLDRWPPGDSLAVVDLARVLSGAYPELLLQSGHAPAFFGAVCKVAGLAAGRPRPSDTVVTLALRAIANVMHLGGDEWATRVFENLGEVQYESLTQVQRRTYAGILSNFAVASLNQRPDPVLRRLHLSLVDQVMRKEKKDVEALYRVLVALGNTVRSPFSHLPRALPTRRSFFAARSLSMSACFHSATCVRTAVRGADTGGPRGRWDRGGTQGPGERGRKDVGGDVGHGATGGGAGGVGDAMMLRCYAMNTCLASGRGKTAVHISSGVDGASSGQ
ncbi:WD40-repeat-containing domain protein [Amylostereum chailletii]|nr:WD40-repeat-containing domain protein [Amylostereum chailletii]